MNRIARAIGSLAYGPHERVFLIEQFGSSYRGTSVIVRGAREVTMRATRSFSDLSRIPFSALKFSHYDTVILALAEDAAASIEGTVRLARNERTGAIDEGELDSLLHHGFWNFLSTYRSEAAEKLKVSELDMVVANVAISGVRIGAHTVFNPLDFSGKEVFLSFRATFVPRTFLPTIRAIGAYARGNVIVVERGVILAAACNEPVVFADIGDARTAAYAAGGEEGMYRGACAWGVSHIVRALADYFGVDERVVPALLNRYTNNQISERVRYAVNRVVREETKKVALWLKEIADGERKRRRVTVRYMVSSECPVPQSFFEGLSAEYASFPSFRESGDAGGPIRKSERGVSESVRALILYPYLHPHYQPINQLLQRRVKWLVPHQ
jgi:hypothetical protein